MGWMDEAHKWFYWNLKRLSDVSTVKILIEKQCFYITWWFPADPVRVHGLMRRSSSSWQRAVWLKYCKLCPARERERGGGESEKEREREGERLLKHRRRDLPPPPPLLLLLQLHVSGFKIIPLHLTDMFVPLFLNHCRLNGRCLTERASVLRAQRQTPSETFQRERHHASA